MTYAQWTARISSYKQVLCPLDTCLEREKTRLILNSAAHGFKKIMNLAPPFNAFESAIK